MEDLRENRPFESLVGFLVNSGRRFFFFSLSLFLSFLCLSTMLISFSFSRFLCVAGRFLSSLGRLSANTAMRADLCRNARAGQARRCSPTIRDLLQGMPCRGPRLCGLAVLLPRLVPALFCPFAH